MLYMVYHCSLHITSVPLTPLAHISVPTHDSLLLALPSLAFIIKHVPDPIPLPCMHIACGSTPVKQKSPRSRVSSRILGPSQGDEPCAIYPASAPRWHITHIRFPGIISCVSAVRLWCGVYYAGWLYCGTLSRTTLRYHFTTLGLCNAMQSFGSLFL